MLKSPSAIRFSPHSPPVVAQSASDVRQLADAVAGGVAVDDVERDEREHVRLAREAHVVWRSRELAAEHVGGHAEVLGR